jgi:hypothetical protein
MGFPSSDAACSAEQKRLIDKGIFGSASYSTGRSMGQSMGQSENSVVGIDAITPIQNEFTAQGIVLPPLQCEAFISQRHEVNPALALNLLQDIQVSVGHWQQQQRQIVQALQALYAQGPMVDGWLQSSLSPAEARSVPQDASAAILRHGDAEALMQYVEALEIKNRENSATEKRASAAADSIEQGTERELGYEASDSSSQYQLCSLQKDGSIHSRPCPAEQVALVSTAIARYQKFKQMMSQQYAIEAKLQQAVDLLSEVRTQLQPD